MRIWVHGTWLKTRAYDLERRASLRINAIDEVAPGTLHNIHRIYYDSCASCFAGGRKKTGFSWREQRLTELELHATRPWPCVLERYDTAGKAPGERE